MSYSIPGYSEALEGVSAKFDLAAAKVREFSALCNELRRWSGRKPAGGRLLRSKRLRKKAGFG